MRLSTIYVLRDPSTNEVRYLGYSSNLQRRLSHHLYYARVSGKLPVEKWIASLASAPVMEALEETDKPQEREIYWIERLRAEGVDLLNVTKGGYGTLGVAVSDELRKKMSDSQVGRTLSSEHIANMSKSLTGRSQSDETKRKIAAGQTKSWKQRRIENAE